MQAYRYKYPVALFLSLIALGVSVYLAYHKYNVLAVPCSISGGCETVLNSKYSSILGLPLPYLGVLYFTLGTILCAVSFKNVGLRRYYQIYAGLGALGALSLITIQLTVLHAICRYCMAVDLSSILLFLWLVNVPNPVVPPKSEVVV
jgi:uncharacterized membrane protein